MTVIKDIVRYFNEKIPSSLSCAWDNDGLMCCPDESAPVSGVLCALDITDDVIHEAEALGFNLILTHHPLLFRPIRSVLPSQPSARYVISLISKEISVLSYHTRLDAVEGGVNDQLAALFRAQIIGCFGPEGEEVGRMVRLPTPLTAKDFADHVKRTLKCPSITLVNPEKSVKTVAVVGGEGRDYISPAISCGADIMLTGNVGYHGMLDAAAQGLAVIEAGHDYTERIIASWLYREIQKEFPALSAAISEIPSPIVYL